MYVSLDHRSLNMHMFGSFYRTLELLLETLSYFWNTVVQVPLHEKSLYKKCNPTHQNVQDFSNLLEPCKLKTVLTRTDNKFIDLFSAWMLERMEG